MNLLKILSLTVLMAVSPAILASPRPCYVGFIYDDRTTPILEELGIKVSWMALLITTDPGIDFRPSKETDGVANFLKNYDGNYIIGKQLQTILHLRLQEPEASQAIKRLAAVPKVKFEVHQSNSGIDIIAYGKKYPF